MAPEMVRFNAPVDQRADIYALGCVAFECVTGRPPFQRADLLAKKLNARGRGWVHVNPIPLNPTPGSIWTSSEPDVTQEFIDRLNDAGIPTTLRDTRGKEIDGACGQLAAEGDEEADGAVTAPETGRSGASASIDLRG